MAGLDRDTPIPTEIKLHQTSRLLEISFSDGENFKLSYELLRVYSPSAEVRGHAPGQEILQTGKKDVLITAVDPVGNYAIKPTFSDGHDSGIYSWDLLYDLGINQEDYWEDYLGRLKSNCARREAEQQRHEAEHACACGSSSGESGKGSCGGHRHEHDHEEHGAGGCGGNGQGGCGHHH